MLRTAAAVIALFISSAISLAADDFSYLIGKWTATTGPNIGAPFWFKKAFAGFDAIIPWWGQTTIIESGGQHASHLKIVGSKEGVNTECFYYVSKLDSRRMAWNLRYPEATSTSCPGSLLFERQGDSDVEEALKKAQFYIDAKDWDTALAYANAAMRSDPTSAQAFRWRGRAQYGKQNFEASIADYTEAIRLSADASPSQQALFYHSRGNIYARIKEYVKAISSYSDAIRLDPENAEIWTSRAVSYEHQKDYVSAQKDFDEAIRRNPNLQNVKDRLAQFTPNFCNEYSSKISIAIVAGKVLNSTDLTVEGWWELEPNSCVELNYRLKSLPLYWIADAVDGYSWRGSTENALNASFCISKENYNRRHTAAYSCSSGETLERFRKANVGENNLRHTIRLIK